MNSKDALKRKVDDLQKQAEEIEELGIKLLEETHFRQREERGGFFISLEYRSPLKKIQREAIQKYQQWYSTSLQMLDEYTPEWLNDFKLHYTHPNNEYFLGVMEYLRLGCFTSCLVKEGVSVNRNWLIPTLSEPTCLEPVKKVPLK